MMKRSKGTLVKFLIVLISFFCIDGGRSLLLISNKMQILFPRDQINDVEVPHQHHIVNFFDEEKWLESFKFDFSCFNHNSVKFLFTLNTVSQEYSDSIWQPPKFV
jgi:hypothetical protein